jgi:hypothetical protein
MARKDDDGFMLRWRDEALWSFVGTLFLTAIMRAGQAGGVTRMDLPLMLGTVTTADRDRAKVYGSLIHLVNGWIFGSVYVAAFHSLRRASWLIGAMIGLVHGLFVLIAVLPLLPGAHRRMASTFTGPQPTSALEPPGFMALNYGRTTPIVTVVGHIVYGAIIGHFYEVGASRRRSALPVGGGDSSLRADVAALSARDR